MATRNTDVNLIIKARTEGEKAIAALGDTLEHVFTGAREGGVDLATLARNLGTLDKAAGTVAGSVDKAAAALDRQKSSITENKAALAALVAQQSEARQVLAGFGEQADKAFVGPRTEGFTKTFTAVRAEADRLEAAVSRLTATIGTQESQLQGTQSSLLRLSSISRAVGEGQAEAAAQIELTTEALRRQGDESRRAAAAQSFYNAKGGPSRGSASDNGATYDALIANLQRLEGEAARASVALDPIGNAIRDSERAIRDVREAASHGIIASDDAIIRERQLRDELDQTIAKIAAGAARVRQVRKDSVTEYQALINSVTGVTGPKATDSGATYEALAQREAETQRLQQQQRARDAETLRAAAERNSGVSAAPATSAGAGFSALEAEAQATALRAASSAYGAFENAVRKGAEAMREADAAVERDNADLRQLREAMDPLAAIQERLNASLARYRELAAAGKLSTEELAAAERHAATEAERQRNSLGSGQLGAFGLRPYELQNLSYQINDVVTGLASGQHLGQVVAQQGGQILQLFPKVGGAIVGALSNPIILAAVAGFTALALAIGRAASEAERLRDTTADLKLSADGTIYDPEKLDDSAKGLRGYGASIDDATKALKVFTEAGLNPQRLDEFGRSAQDLADVTGIKLPDAAKKLADGFSGGYDAIAKLDDELNFLTATQRESIKQAFEDGNAQQARAEAFGILSAKLSESAAIQRGPATEATRNLKKGYDDLLDSLARTSLVQGTIDLFGKLGKVISEATGNASAFTTATERAARVTKLHSDITDLQSKYDNTKRQSSPLFPRFGELDDIKAEIDAKQSELKQLVAQQQSEAKAAGQQKADTIANGREEQKKADIAAGVARDRLLVQAQKQEAAEKGVTNEAAKQLRLRVAEQTARQQIEASSPKASDSVKQSYVDAARANELATISREEAQRAKAAKAEREREISQFEGRVVGAEGGAGKNPFSTAKGYGQFTEGTFKDQFRKVFPGEASKLSDTQVLALRQNEQVARAIIDNYARENAKFLESFGAKVTAGNLYLAHFLGAVGAKAVLTASKDRPVDQILSGKVLSGNQGYLRTEGGKGRYRTAGELQAFINNRVGDTGAAQTQGQIAINDLIDEAKKKQDAFNQSLRHANEDRQDSIKALTEENGLYGVALLATQRAKVITDAEREARQKAEDANRDVKPGETPVLISDEQVKTARDAAAALFDVQHARDLLNAKQADAQRPVDELQQQSDLLKQQAEYLRSIGDNADADKLDKQILSLSGSIQTAYDKLIAFYEALTKAQRVDLGIDSDQQFDNIIGKLEQAKQSTQEWGKIAGVSSKEIAQSFASGLTNTVTSFINKIASGKNVFKSLSEGVREFAANFISSIAQMILQLLAYAAAVSILRALGVPVPATSVATHHSGGVVGSAGGQKRNVSPSIFAGAMRFHTGGIAGIGPDEVGAVLKRGEEVLTEGDPRHRANGGLSGGGGSQDPSSLKIVNAFDQDTLASQLLSTKAGEKTILNLISRNPRAFKAALGG